MLKNMGICKQTNSRKLYFNCSVNIAIDYLKVILKTVELMLHGFSRLATYKQLTSMFV